MARETEDRTKDQQVPKDPESAAEVPGVHYQSPRLTYVGNVHSLLAGAGPSPTPDTNKGSISHDPGA
jgi:hypothetical protein